jgi:hypothetical protein
VQTTLVAGPRNHFYRTGRLFTQAGPFCVIFDAELDHFGDLADDLGYVSVVVAKGAKPGDEHLQLLADRSVGHSRQKAK